MELAELVIMNEYLWGTDRSVNCCAPSVLLPNIKQQPPFWGLPVWVLRIL